MQSYLMKHRPIRSKKSQNLVQLTESDYVLDIVALGCLCCILSDSSAKDKFKQLFRNRFLDYKGAFIIYVWGGL
jgi:hypothetical protein